MPKVVSIAFRRSPIWVTAVALKLATSLIGEARLKESFLSAVMRAVFIAGMAIRSTRPWLAFVVETQALSVPVLEAVLPVIAVIGASMTMARILVPAKVSVGAPAPAARRPVTGIYGLLVIAWKPARSKKKGSSRKPANTFTPPAVVTIGVVAPGGVMAAVIGAPRPSMMTLFGLEVTRILRVISSVRPLLLLRCTWYWTDGSKTPRVALSEGAMSGLTSIANTRLLLFSGLRKAYMSVISAVGFAVVRGPSL